MHSPPGRPFPLALICGLWLAAFTAVFFLVTLPNNAISRLAILDFLPDVFATAVPNTETESLRFLPQRLPLLTIAAVLLAGAWGLGDLALRVARVPLTTWSIDRFILAAGLGLSLTSLLVLALGLAGWMSMILLSSLLAASFLAALVLSILKPLRTDSALSPDSPLTPHPSPLVPAATTLFVVVIVLGACLPSFDFDVNAYHFPGPKEWYQQGQITFLPHNVYTSFPFLTEMLVLGGMIFKQDWNGGAVAGKVLLSAYAPLTALGLYAIGRRWFSPLAGAIAALVYVSAPWTFRISTIAYVEGALSFYLLATVWAVMQAWESRRSAVAGPWFLLAGLMAGSAMACKYPGLVSVVLPAGVVCVFIAWADRARFLKSLGLFVLGVTVTIGPWLVKNLVETGNPVYPLAWKVFGGRDWDADLNARWNRGHFSHSFTLSEAARGMADVTVLNDWLSPLFFGLAPLSLLALYSERAGASPRFFTGAQPPETLDARAAPDGEPGASARPLIAGLWLYLLYLVATWWLLTHRIDRFFVPQHPVVALLAGIGFAGIAGALRVRWPVYAWVVTICVFNLGIVLLGFANYSKLFVDLREAHREAVARTAPEIGWLNANLPPDSKVLCVGEAETFYAEFPLAYNTVFDKSVFEEWFATPDGRLRPAEEIRRKLRAEGITHIYVNWLEVIRYRATYGFTDFVTRAPFTELQQRGVLGEALYIPEARTSADDLWERNPSWKPHLEALGTELLVPSGGRTLLKTFEVFPAL